MKTLRILLVSAVVMALAASCLEQNETYKAGFYFTKPSSASNAFFANNLGDTLSFMSFGNWSISRRATDDGSWFTINTTSGKGNTLYNFPVMFEPNTTGKGRGVQLIFSDTDHPGDAQASSIYWQYGMRGDGTLGSARDVKAITGSRTSKWSNRVTVSLDPTGIDIITLDALDGNTIVDVFTTSGQLIRKTTLDNWSQSLPRGTYSLRTKNAAFKLAR